MAVLVKFTLRNLGQCDSVHVLGSWNNYTKQLPLSKDSNQNEWLGSFKFEASTLKQGQRYWYYVRHPLS